MAMHSRYSTGEEESQEILKNRLGIQDQATLDDTETLLLADTYEYFFGLLEKGKIKFNLKLVFEINKYFLTTLYDWAGKIRTVEMSKGGILFCASSQIRRALKVLEKIIMGNQILPDESIDAVSGKLAVIHCEFNAIHPFREGNGRTGRIFLDLMAASNGYQPIDFGKSAKTGYIRACVAGMQGNYSPMAKIIKKGLSK